MLNMKFTHYNLKLKIIFSLIIVLLLSLFVGFYFYAVTGDHHKPNAITLAELAPPTKPRAPDIISISSIQQPQLVHLPVKSAINEMMQEPSFTVKALNNGYYSKSFFLFHKQFSAQVIDYCSNNVLATQVAATNCNLAFDSDSKAQLFTGLFGIGNFVFNETPFIIWLLLGAILFIHLLKLLITPLKPTRTAMIIRGRCSSDMQ